MVAVDSENNVMVPGGTFVSKGVPYTVVGVEPPKDGSPGFLTVVDTTTGLTKKVYPTKFGGKWSQDPAYDNKYRKNLGKRK